MPLVKITCATLLQSCSILCEASQALLSMGFSRQEYWSGLPCSPPGGLPDPGIEPISLKSPALAGEFFSTSATWELVLSEGQPPSPGNPLLFLAPTQRHGLTVSASTGGLWVQNGLNVGPMDSLQYLQLVGHSPCLTRRSRSLSGAMSSPVKPGVPGSKPSSERRFV